jgi:Patatin-like phospholipase
VIRTDRPRRVAIACQGGGSHTAFTAGVLKGVLRETESSKYRIVALSGTSGGAVCALLAWYGLLDGDSARASRLLDDFWSDNSASAPHQQLLNSWLMWASQLQNYVATPALSPYDNPFSPARLEEFRTMLLQQVDFDHIEVDRIASKPMLVVGAVDVLSGEFRAFNSWRERISVDAILASAAIPNRFRSIHAWRSQDAKAVMEFFGEESELVSSSPFPEQEPLLGRSQIRRFVIDHLTEDVTVDLNRKQVARNRVTWRVSVHGRDPQHRVQGVAEAVFKDRQIIAFRLDGVLPGSA